MTEVLKVHMIEGDVNNMDYIFGVFGFIVVFVLVIILFSIGGYYGY